MTMDAIPLFRAKNLHKSYHSGTEKIHILKGVNLTINKGEMMAIVGASGSGKTTLLQILGTLDTADEGKLFLTAKTFVSKANRNFPNFVTVPSVSSFNFTTCSPNSALWKM